MPYCNHGTGPFSSGKKNMRRRLWLCLPPAVFEMIDYGVTMRGQPAAYWSGNLHAAQEANPVVHWCMTTHPLLFHGLTFVWLAAFSLFIMTTPRALARFASLAIAFSHAWAIGTWLYHDETAFLRVIALCISCAILMTIALELSEREA